MSYLGNVAGLFERIPSGISIGISREISKGIQKEFLLRFQQRFFQGFIYEVLLGFLNPPLALLGSFLT